MKTLFFVFGLLINATISFAADLSTKTYLEGLTKSFSYLAYGSYAQFQEKNNLYYAVAAAPMLWYSFEEDKRISRSARRKNIPGVMQFTSDLAPVMGLPVISFITFSYGVKTDNQKLIQFSTEYFGAMYLAFIESAAISLFNVHERPSTANLSKIETSLRGKSSFPSGHVIPYATLALKTYQFYGPLWAIAPTGLFVLTSMQRVRDGKHYLSDVVGGFFLSAFASEGVRRVGNFQDNHPTYKYLFESNVSVGIVEHRGVIGPKISLDWK